MRRGTRRQPAFAPQTPTRAFFVPRHITQYEGGNALSPLRAAQLLRGVRQAGQAFGTLSARYIHLVVCAEAPDPPMRARLAQLLDYGEPVPMRGATTRGRASGAGAANGSP